MDESEPLGLVSRLYAADTATEPFLPILNCSHNRIVQIYIH